LPRGHRRPLRPRRRPGRQPGRHRPAHRRPRRPLGTAMLLSAERSVLLLVDLQQRLMPAIHGGEAVVATAARLAEAARLLDVPVLATEQYPEGLGPTVGSLAGYPRATLAKT